MPARTLTKKAKFEAEKSRIGRLTHTHEQHFKIIFSHQIEDGFKFASLYRGRGSSYGHMDYAKIFRALGSFMDDSLFLSMTEVEAKYFRPTDARDGTYDPETNSRVQVEHFCLFEREAGATVPSDSVRIHGYMRTNGGYFIITRLDWFHGVQS